MVPMVSEILDTPVSQDLVLAQLKMKEQYCKDSQDSRYNSKFWSYYKMVVGIGHLPGMRGYGSMETRSL